MRRMAIRGLGLLLDCSGLRNRRREAIKDDCLTDQYSNLHLTSESPFQSSTCPTSLISSAGAARLWFCFFNLHPSKATTIVLANREARAMECPTMKRGPSFARYNCVPITAPRFPMLICMALAMALLVCPETLMAGHKRTTGRPVAG